MKQVVFVLMAKQPHPGETKTRLVPPLTYWQAANLYEALLRDTIKLLAGLDWADFAIAISPPGAKAYFQAVTPVGTRLLPIIGANIGECLSQALGELFALGYNQAIAVNADGPSLPVAYLLQAAGALKDHDLVLGEGHDGGYYLVGMKKLHQEIFHNIDWSTTRVLDQTLEKAAQTGLQTALTPQWYDVDRVEDLARLQKEILVLHPERLPHTRRFLETFRLDR